MGLTPPPPPPQPRSVRRGRGFNEREVANLRSWGYEPRPDEVEPESPMQEVIDALAPKPNPIIEFVKNTCPCGRQAEPGHPTQGWCADAVMTARDLDARIRQLGEQRSELLGVTSAMSSAVNWRTGR